METKNKVHSFEEVALCDPSCTLKSLENAKETVRIFDFYTEVYPSYIMQAIMEALNNNEKVQPPKCVFIPETEMLRVMIRALVEHGNKDTEEVFLLRFGLVKTIN
jgi:hypothetical protein